MTEEPIDILPDDEDTDDTPLTLADIITEAGQIVTASEDDTTTIREISDWSLDLIRDLLDWAAEQLP